MWQDIRVAWRFLLKQRTGTIITVVTLGIAIGSSTIATGALDNAFWRSIHTSNGSSLLTFYNTRAAAPQFQVLSYGDYATLCDRLRDRVDVAAFVRTFTTLEGIAQPAYIQGELVSDNYFGILAAAPFTGRLIGDKAATHSLVLVLSYDSWRHRFGGDPNIVGSSIQLGREFYTVIGVTRPDFEDPAYPSEFWAPLAATPQLLGVDLSRMHVPYLQTIARPRPGVTQRQVQSYVAGLTTDGTRDGWRLAALRGIYLRFWPAYRTTVLNFLGIFAALAVAILVIACANVAGLQLARGAERGRELAVRQALGATRLQLFRRLAAESVLLTAAGGATGVLLAWWSAPLFRNIPMPVPAPVTLTFDGRLVAIALGISLVASLAFTAVAAWKGTREDAQQVLKSSSRGATSKTMAQRTLVVAQLAVGCVVVTAAVLLLRSFWNVQRIDVGFDPADRVAAQVSLRDQNYSDSRAAIFYRRLQEALERTPEVEGVAFESRAVLERFRAVGTFRRPQAPEPLSARFDAMSPGYFRTMGVPILVGRAFDDHDTESAETVMIVNRTMARLLGGDPLGQILIEEGTIFGRRSGTSVRIIGVVGDVQYNGITEGPQPYVYLPAAQWPSTDLEVYIHTRMSAIQAIALLREQVHQLDPQVALTDVGTLTDRVTEAGIVPRSSALASMALAAIAVFLALVGVYGVLTVSIENQRRELAIRSALGASPSNLILRVIREGTLLTSGALVFGVAGSLAGARTIAGLLFGLPPYDLWSIAAATCLIVAASAVAWIGPARRAASTDAATALRAE
ncbi:MAG TPA: ADOP family duplicated permease [Vicinamibacterales bacterium]|jgi:predicted permease